MTIRNAQTADSTRAAGGEIHTSVLLQELIDSVTADHFTLEWLMGHLPRRSFGVIMLFLALISLLPVISVMSRLLVIIFALQIILGYPGPILPRGWLKRELPSHYLVQLNKHAIPLLQKLEKVVRPRWPLLMKGTRRFTAFIAVLLTILSLIAPLPFANVPPAAVCVLIALAYIEHDGLLLTVALSLAIGMLVVVGLAVA